MNIKTKASVGNERLFFPMGYSSRTAIKQGKVIKGTVRSIRIDVIASTVYVQYSMIDDNGAFWSVDEKNLIDEN